MIAEIGDRNTPKKERLPFRPALIGHLKDLHLPMVRECYEETARRAEREALSYEQYLLEVISRECEQRGMSKVQRLLKALPGVHAMLTALSGKKPPDSLATVVFDETEGNPFFVEEVFQHLSEEGKLFDEAGNWRTGLRSGELDVPQGVRLVIGKRLERLPEETRRILTTAAVIGRSFDLRLLEALEPRQPDAVLDAIEAAERAQLVEPDRSGREIRYRFVHELVRQTLADALSLPRVFHTGRLFRSGSTLRDRQPEQVGYTSSRALLCGWVCRRTSGLPTAMVVSSARLGGLIIDIRGAKPLRRSVNSSYIPVGTCTHMNLPVL